MLYEVITGKIFPESLIPILLLNRDSIKSPKTAITEISAPNIIHCHANISAQNMDKT